MVFPRVSSSQVALASLMTFCPDWAFLLPAIGRSFRSLTFPHVASRIKMLVVHAQDMANFMDDIPQEVQVVAPACTEDDTR